MRSLSAVRWWCLGFALLLATHAPLLSLPYFWDELGQFIPASLDILQSGAWVPRMTTPNVHPPGVMAYLALVWRIFGYSITATRIAMLAVAALGLASTYALAKRLGASPFWSALLLFVTPLFFTQSMMAQLDMPAMALTTAALVLFLDRRYAWCAACCTLLVLTKETSIVAPIVFAVAVSRTGLRPVTRDIFHRLREPAYFLAPLTALGIWLLVLRAVTGNVLGDSEFAQYNVGYALNPVRALFAILRRIFYLFFADFRVLGTAAAIWLWSKHRQTFAKLNPAWKLCLVFAVLQTLAVTLLGGAALERYLLPVFPILCAALASIPKTGIRAGLVAGLAISNFWAPPYPFPFENNLAVVDFVRLQQRAAAYVEANYPSEEVASAWPFTDAIRRPEFGYVSKPLHAVDSRDFAVSVFDPKQARVVVVYTRVWPGGLLPYLSPIMRRFYGYDRPITADDLGRRNFHRVGYFEQGGQSAEIYAHP